MSINNGKISAPLGWPELAAFFGCGEDEGQICTSKNINPCAKYKPTRWNKLSVREGDDNTSLILFSVAGADSYYYWQGQDGKCGFDIPTTSAVIATQNDEPIWEYLLPRPAVYPTPFDPAKHDVARVDDFIGYYHYATNEWGLPLAPSRIFANGTGFRLSFNMLMKNEDSLCYQDIFDTNNTESTNGIYICLANASGNTVTKKVPIDWTTGKCVMELTSDDLLPLGLSNRVGQNIRLHYYGMFGGRNVSLRNHADTLTFYNIPIVSVLPYSYALYGSFLCYEDKSDPYNDLRFTYYLWHIRATLDARNYIGGEFGASRVRVYQTEAGRAADWYWSNSTPIWTSSSLAATTVAAGTTKDVLTSTDYEWMPTGGGRITSITVIWYDENNVVLESLRISVTDVATRPM